MRWLASSLVWRSITHRYTLAAFISLQTLEHALVVFGYPAVTLFVMIESAGIPLPGETMLLLASFYTALNPKLQLPLVIASAAVGAIVGDNIGYSIGRTGGRAFVTRFGRFFFVKAHHLAYAERFFERHGGKTVFFGRFTAILRTWSAFLAGIHHMPWRTFLFYNAAGGILWSVLYGLLGYVAGHFFHNNFDQIEALARTMGWTTAGILLVVVLAAVFILRWRHKRSIRASAALSNDHPKTTSVHE